MIVAKSARVPLKRTIGGARATNANKAATLFLARTLCIQDCGREHMRARASCFFGPLAKFQVKS